MRKQWVGLGVGLVLLVASAIGAGGAAGADVSSEPAVLRFHGGGYDTAGDLAVDATGALYLAGAVDKANSPTTFAVSKVRPDGTVQWTTHYGGSRGGGGGPALAVTLDAAGNVYVAGIVGDGVIFNTNWDYLVMKVGPDGVEQWAQRYDGPARGFDQPVAVAVDAAGSVYVSGFSYGQNYDWATLKYAADGALAWERRHAAPGWADDRVADMALTPNGTLVLTGTTQPNGDGMTNDVDTLSYDPQGTVLWHRRWTDTSMSHERPLDLDVDDAGRIAITGTTAENPSPYVPPFPVTLRYDASGTLLQTIQDTNAGGSAVDVSGDGNVFLAGAFFATEGASSVARYDPAGNLIWATPLTVGERDAAGVVAVAADAAGAVTVAGTIADISTGDGDYLIVRYSSTGAEQWRYRFAGPASGHDRVAALALAGSDAFVTGTSWNDYLSIGGTADDIVTLRFGAGAAPALLPPTELGATALTATQVRLEWRDQSGTETGFRIERCTGTACTTFVQVATVGHDVTTYVDGGLAKLTTYRYRVAALNDAAVSPYSNIATTKTKRR